MFDEGSRPVWAEVSLANVAYNIESIRRQVPPATEIMAVVKADGYGHGAVRVSGTLLQHGANRLAVGTLEEGIELRRAGYEVPILILGWTPPSRAPEVIAYHLTQAVLAADQARALDEAAAAMGRKAGVHIKVDTGMNRIGFPVVDPDSLRQVITLARLPHLEIEGVFTHLAAADERNKGLTYRQLEAFAGFTDRLSKSGLNVRYRHAANSAAILDVPESFFDLVRPGIMLYGLYPSSEVSRSVELRPAMAWKARVAYVKRIGPGAGVSYGHTFTAPEEMTIATLPLGYADGYSRAFSNRGVVLVGACRCPVVGRVCMDQIMVAVPDGVEVRAGDEAVIMGCQGDEEIPADELAALLGTVNYEVICMVAKRVPRHYLE